jgi:hypothetical protein
VAAGGRTVAEAVAAPPGRSAGTRRSERLAGAASWWSARPALGAAAIYALLALLMTGQGLLPGHTLSGSDFVWDLAPWGASRPSHIPPQGTNFELADATDVFFPFLQFTREHLPEIPLWNPYIMGGRPFVANMQSAVFSPFSWPSYVLPFWTSLAVVAWLKLFAAAMGTYLLGREIGMRFGGALLAGVIFPFSTYFTVWMTWPLTSAFALVPWVILLGEIVLRRPGPLPAGALALLTAAVLLGGHPESSFQAMALAVIWFSARILARARREGVRPMVRPAVTYALALTAGAAISAVAVVPFLELLLRSGDLERRADAPAGHYPARYLGGLFLHDYWGRPTNGSLIEPFLVVRAWYVGALTLMLATAALVLRPDRLRIGVAALGVGLAMLVLGADPVHAIVNVLPGFSSAHNERTLIYVLFALALLAGWGLDELTSRRTATLGRRRLVVAASAAILLIPVAWMIAAGTLKPGLAGWAVKLAWGFVDPPPGALGDPAGHAADIVRNGALAIWLPLAAAALGLTAWALAQRRSAAVVVTLAVVLVAVDLFRANMGYNPAIRRADATQPVTPAVAYLQDRVPNRFVGVSLDIARQPLPADLAMRYGLYDGRGYDFPAEKRYDTLWRRFVVPGIPDFAQPDALAGATPAAVRAMSVLSVSDLLAAPDDQPLRGPGLRVAYRGKDAIIYRNERALPRLFLVGRQQVIPDADAQLRAVTHPRFDGRRVAVTEHRLPGLAEGAGGAPPVGSARFERYDPDRVVARSRADRRSLLVLSDVHYPGWKARVDGRDAPLERVDYLLRGVVVPAGTHRVEFRYEPVSWRAGWIISVLGLLAVTAALVAGLRARRRA